MRKPILLLFGTALLWSLGGVLIKSIDWNPIAIAGTRSLIGVILFLCFLPDTLRQISWRTVPGALAYSSTVILFVAATKLTTAANAIFLQYTAPIYIAIIGPWLLQEKTSWLDWILIAVALGGVALFFVDKLTLDGRTGICLALASGLSYGLLTLLMRKQRRGSPESIVLLGNLFTCLIAVPWFMPITNLRHNLPFLLILGIVQLTIPYLLYSKAIRRVRALDAAIIAILEPILNPIWVMLATREVPSPWAVAGGAIVLCASLARGILASRTVVSSSSAEIA